MIVNVVRGTVDKCGNISAIMEESLSIGVPNCSFPNSRINLREPGFVGFHEEGQLEELECHPIIGVNGRIPFMEVLLPVSGVGRANGGVCEEESGSI
jgi:hypothetical protein